MHTHTCVKKENKKLIRSWKSHVSIYQMQLILALFLVFTHKWMSKRSNDTISNEKKMEFFFCETGMQSISLISNIAWSNERKKKIHFISRPSFDVWSLSPPRPRHFRIKVLMIAHILFECWFLCRKDMKETFC